MDHVISAELYPIDPTRFLPNSQKVIRVSDAPARDINLR